MASNFSKFETSNAQHLIRQMEQIRESPELAQSMQADAKRFLVRRVIPCALAAEFIGVAFAVAIGARTWAIAALTAAASVAVFMIVAALWPRR